MFRSAAALDPARPFITFYDDATGERVELSFATFDNWVSKTANLIQDGLPAEPGQQIALLLPVHWQTLVWYLACWSAGAIAAPGLDPAAADHVVTAPESLTRALACPGERIALSLRPLGGRFTEPLPAGVLDYAVEVPGYGDRFTPMRPPDPDAAALRIGDRTWTGAELAAAAHAAGADLAASDRIMSSADPTGWDGLRTVLLGPIAAGAAVVLCRNPEPSLLPARTSMERITRTA